MIVKREKACIQKKVNELDFDRIRFKLSQNDEGILKGESINLAEKEYRRFLILVGMFRHLPIVPTKLVDEFWHQHILDTKAYREDCQAVFGTFIDHYPYFGIYGDEDAKELDKAFEKTKDLYWAVFQEEIPEVLASRCEGHACHVPSECACRVEGACKSVIDTTILSSKTR